LNTNFKSTEYKTNKPVIEIIGWLMNAANHAQLMPSEITGFTSNGNKMQYNLAGLADLELEISQKNENTIEIHPLGNVPFPFVFSWKITENTEGSMIQSFLDADLNFIFKMAAGKKLQKLIDFQAEKLQEISNANS